LARLKDAVGANGFSTEPADIAPHLEEWRSKYHGHSPLLLKPVNAQEVSAILRVCNQTGTPLVTQGGNTAVGGRANSSSWRSATLHPKVEPDPQSG
jgi:FAD/FMN-containing dehydrogenase